MYLWSIDGNFSFVKMCSVYVYTCRDVSKTVNIVQNHLSVDSISLSLTENCTDFFPFWQTVVETIMHGLVFSYVGLCIDHFIGHKTVSNVIYSFILFVVVHS